MSTLVDPTLCPDCRARLDSNGACPGCGLVLQGPLAAQLWRLMVDADAVIAQLRAARVTSGAASPGVAPGLAPEPAPGAMPGPTPGAPRRSWRLPSASVPVVLLSLGALCLLVAAVVFVAVTWSLLGITGRTLVLLGLTGVLAAVAVVLTRRELRGAAETFWLVVAGMLCVDVLGARSAGLFGLDSLGSRGTGAVLGTTLLVFGVTVGLWVRSLPLARLHGVAAVAVAGALVVTSTNGWLAADQAVGTAVAVPTLAALAALLHRRLSTTAYGLAGLAGVSWLMLLAVGWSRAFEPGDLSDWWLRLGVWPLLVAAVLMAPGVYARPVPEGLRSVAAGLTLVPLVLAAAGPQWASTDTRDAVVASALLLALALLAALGPRHWARGAAVLAGLGVLGVGLALAVGPWEVLSLLEPVGRTSPTLRLLAPDDPAAWTFGVLGLSVAGAGLLLLRHVPARHLPSTALSVGALAPTAIALGGLGLVLYLEPTLWGATLAAGVATAVAAAAAWWVRTDAVAGWVGVTATSYLAGLTLWAAAADDLLWPITLSVGFVALAVVYGLREQSGSARSAVISGVLAALAGAVALDGWGRWTGADVDERAVVVAVYAALVGLFASPGSRRTTSRIGFEVTGLLVGVLATATAVDLRASAMALTVIGTAVCVIGVAYRDREGLGWVGAVLLGAATAVRVLADVQAPELYTLPAAALLVAVGAWRLAGDREANSFLVLGSGLTLGLLPSLLLALEEPVSLRGALIGAAGVAVLAAGVWRRLASPFVLGAGTTALLALRHLQPYADAVPRWMSLGAVGLALLVVGVTWEARRRNLQTAGRYLGELR